MGVESWSDDGTLLTRQGGYLRVPGTPPGASGGGGATPIAFVQGDTYSPFSAASASFTLPGSLVDGNTIVLAVAHRSTIDTPDGYTLLATSTGVEWGGKVALFQKVCDGDQAATVEFTFGASGRGSVGYAELAGAATVDDIQTGTTTANNAPGFEVPEVTASETPGVLIVAAWNELSAGTGYVASPSLTVFSTDYGSDDRLGMAYQPIEAPGSISGLIIENQTTPEYSGVVAVFV